MELDKLKRWFLWVSIIAGVLTILGVLGSFFVNLYTIQQLRMKKALDNTKTNDT